MTLCCCSNRTDPQRYHTQQQGTLNSNSAPLRHRHSTPLGHSSPTQSRVDLRRCTPCMHSMLQLMQVITRERWRVAQQALPAA
jgi:hypothetical protein